MKTIKTFSERNAVKVVAFAFNFAERISDENIKSIITNLKENNILSQFKNDITTEISMTIGPNGIPNQKITEGGISFNKEDQWFINVSKDFITIICREYTRWKTISEEVYKYMEVLFKIIDKKSNQITLEYLDEFEILDKTKWQKELFNESSEFINKNIYSCNDFWHLNQGMFTKITDIPYKVLDTININYFADEQDSLKNKINIRCQHILLIENQINIQNNILKEYLDKIHLHSKNIFENIVNKNIINGFKE